ncbi:hypothetical protein HPB47_008702 [Ixodes persulcatus]|uniref:Uncharacterized protein n=1 Tax=Ixodes persulcatus TaxID=34615 RepID=A0AC60P415_IXOPE|nr:hypothetical protein HPB47_008702 [Ixodes persulcatus]
MAAASGEPSGNPWELTDDALEPGSRLGRSAAVHATEFRPTGAPRIAAAQEQAAADPLPQRGLVFQVPTLRLDPFLASGIFQEVPEVCDWSFEPFPGWILCSDQSWAPYY